MMTDLPEPTHDAIDEMTVSSVINQSNACLHHGLYIDIHSLSDQTYINACHISNIAGKLLSRGAMPMRVIRNSFDLNFK